MAVSLKMPKRGQILQTTAKLLENHLFLSLWYHTWSSRTPSSLHSPLLPNSLSPSVSWAPLHTHTHIPPSSLSALMLSPSESVPFFFCHFLRSIELSWAALNSLPLPLTWCSAILGPGTQLRWRGNPSCQEEKGKRLYILGCFCLFVFVVVVVVFLLCQHLTERITFHYTVGMWWETVTR